MSDQQTIAAQVAEMTAGRPRPEAFAEEQRRLATQQAPVVRVGVPFPQARLIDATGHSTSVAEVAGGGPAVVVLYRGSWCPYCNVALRTYQLQVLPELTAQGITMIAISPEKEDGSMTLTERHELAFPVLSDPGDAIARALGVLTRPSDASLETQRGRGLDIRDRNADGTADVHPDHTTRTEPEQILRAVREQLASTATPIG